MTNFVVPIPPSYHQNGEMAYKSINSYVDNLASRGVQTIMTTAGTSQYNLLSKGEIIDFNLVLKNSSVPNKILGLPPGSTSDTIDFIKESNIKSEILMILYPDRYYDYKSIIDYCKQIRDVVEKPLYLHAMFMRNGFGGQWNYTSDILNELFNQGIIVGIKEEHSDLQASYNMIRKLPKEMHIIVAGGSMRRHQFLKSAGANAFLSGVGNFFPEIEQAYCNGNEDVIELESKMFDVFAKYGWHPSLRIGLSELNLCCDYDRKPWPSRTGTINKEIYNVLKEIEYEWQDLDTGTLQPGK